jgi:heme-degrading monooxygenase HmoA
VPEGQDEVFLARWREAGDYMRRQEGYVSTQLHQSLDSRARFRFINVAVWRSAADFQRAVGTDEFASIAARMPFTSQPALYRVVAE